MTCVNGLLISAENYVLFRFFLHRCRTYCRSIPLFVARTQLRVAKAPTRASLSCRCWVLAWRGQRSNDNGDEERNRGRGVSRPFSMVLLARLCLWILDRYLRRNSVMHKSNGLAKTWPTRKTTL